MSKLLWFKFSPMDWVMGKIQKCPEVTRIRFIDLCCAYWNKECELSIEDAKIEVDEEHLSIMVSKKVVKIQDGFIRISFLDEQFDNILSVSDKRRNAANERWNKHHNKNNASAMQVHSKSNASAMQTDADKNKIKNKSKEKKNKKEILSDFGEAPYDEQQSILKPLSRPVENESSIMQNDPGGAAAVFNREAIIELFKQITGKTRTKVMDDKATRQFKALWKQGYRMEDFECAITNCFNDPYHTEKKHTYLTLEFISRQDKFHRFYEMDTKTNSSNPKRYRIQEGQTWGDNLAIIEATVKNGDFVNGWPIEIQNGTPVAHLSKSGWQSWQFDGWFDNNKFVKA